MAGPAKAETKNQPHQRNIRPTGSELLADGEHFENEDGEIVRTPGGIHEQLRKIDNPADERGLL